MKTLIVYYSRAFENYVNGEIKNLKVGNTEVAAEMIQEIVGGDIFKIDQVESYSKGYNTCIQEARVDQNKNARPILKETLDSIDEYDLIYLGYPNYWNTMPMAVFTFLEAYDFSGKTIKPFCTHEGSGMGKSVEDIEKLCPHANVLKGLAIHGGDVNNSFNLIESWCKDE